MKLYIDIDGVLLGHVNGEHGLAAGASEFIEYAVNHFECYWLTTHCRGDEVSVLRYLRSYVDDELYEKLQQIKPTNFEIFKTEALNPEDDFIWIEDKPLAAEIDWLDRHAKLDSWWKVDTYEHPDDLKECLEELKLLAG